MEDAAAVTDVLDERPELEDALRAVWTTVEVDGAWEFDDVPVDSGAFGELVDRGLVEKTDDGSAYRFANPAAVRAVLEGDADDRGTESGAEPSVTVAGRRWLRERVETGNYDALLALTGVLVVVVVSRSFVYGSVFRDGAVVLSGNDPYYYRYHVEQLTVGQGSISLGELPPAVANGEPLTVVLLALAAALFGGTPTGAGIALSLYPVVVAVVTATITYLLAVRVTDDRRVGLAAALFLAFMPGYALRTSLGFADHHAFDAFWLSVTAFAAVTALGAQRRTRTATLAALGLGVGVAGQVLAWEAGPILIAPLAVVVAGGVTACIREERSPLAAFEPILVGVVIGAVLVGLVHLVFGWHTTLVAGSAVALAGGSVAVVALGEVWTRRGHSAGAFGGLAALGGVVAAVVFWVAAPTLRQELVSRAAVLFLESGIAETASLLSGDSIGFLLLLGFALVVGMPVLGAVTLAAAHGDRNWLVVAAYTWLLLALSLFQVRFVGELAVVLSVLTGYGFVWLGAWVDITDRPPSPTRPAGGAPSTGSFGISETQTIATWTLLFLLVGGLGMIQTPVKISQITVDDPTYELSIKLANHSEDNGLTYPGGNYVLSPWSDNRVYNYFVNGQSKSYSFAKKRYRTFVLGTDSSDMFDQFDYRTGYVVTTDSASRIGGDRTMGTRLHDHYGSRHGDVPGVGRFRLVGVADGGSVKAFQFVSGAVIAGDAPGADTVSVTTNVTVGVTNFTFRRADVPDQTNYYRIVVPYPGTYTVRAGGETWQVEVTAEDVRTNEYV
jgi:dolichyl-diphosphooligosaccharide--protein glycosyltransferase